MPATEKSTSPVWTNDDDVPDLSAPEWAEVIDCMPVRRGRPRLTRPKQSTTVRLDPDILEYLKSGGPGWQTRLNAFLREAIAAENNLASPR